jgi:hypothetical protein
VVDFETAAGKAAHMVCGTHGEVDAVSLLSSRAPQDAKATRETKVKINGLIYFVRANAARLGINLMAPFVPSPGDPRLAELLAPWAEARERAIEMTKAIRKSDEAAAAKAGALVRSALEVHAGRPEGVAVQ